MKKHNAVFLDGPQAGKSMRVDGLDEPPKRLLLDTLNPRPMLLDDDFQGDISAPIIIHRRLLYILHSTSGIDPTYRFSGTISKETPMNQADTQPTKPPTHPGYKNNDAHTRPADTQPPQRVCEFCYRTDPAATLPDGWDLVWQSAVCDKCIKRGALKQQHTLKGGAWADGKADPRATATPPPAWATEAAEKILGFIEEHKPYITYTDLARIIAEAAPKRLVITQDMAKKMDCPWPPWGAWDKTTQAEVVEVLEESRHFTGRPMVDEKASETMPRLQLGHKINALLAKLQPQGTKGES